MNPIVWQRSSPRLALVVVLAGALVGAAAAVFTAVLPSYTREELWVDCRAVNLWVALVATTLVGYRITFMFLDRHRWRDHRGLHLMLWFAYVAGGLVNVALGSQFLAAANAAAGAPTGLRFVLNVMAIALSIWWPHPRELVHLEETFRGTRT